jgi:very-short-patch-repair endonuclease
MLTKLKLLVTISVRPIYGPRFNVVRFWNLEVFTESERVLEPIYEARVSAYSEAEPSP